MPSYENEIKASLAKFEVLLRAQIERSLRIDRQGVWQIPSAGDKIKIGILPGDEDLPGLFSIVDVILRTLLSDLIEKGIVEIIHIGGLHFESRYQAGKSIPIEILSQIKQCQAIVRGIWREPENGSLESVDAALQKELDLYAHLTPVWFPKREVEWLFFQDVNEGVLPAGGMKIQDLLAIDFAFSTPNGAERLARTAFAYAKARGIRQIILSIDEKRGWQTIESFVAACFAAAKEFDGIELTCMEGSSIESTFYQPEGKQDTKMVLLPYRQDYQVLFQGESEVCMGQVKIGASCTVLGWDEQALAFAAKDSAHVMACTGMLQSISLLFDLMGFYHAADQLRAAMALSMDDEQSGAPFDLISYVDGLLKRIEEM
ncbi:MAG: hypothetical protein HFE77_07820 [Clostridiales bacterium]|nr:hypothetical protein [Clostridiales bacterium]